MTPTDLRYEISKDMYYFERNRREQIRQSLSTPVAAFAFSVFNISTIAVHFEPNFSDLLSTDLAVGLLSGFGLVALITAAYLIIRIELRFIYLAPPDLKELMVTESRIREQTGSEEENIIGNELQNTLSGAYDIAYRRYFVSNEVAARDRTRGLHLIILALIFFSLALTLLPFQEV